jgi:1,4-alpha-glucan branching enzyme
VPVRFEFNHPTATSVCVAGTFNDWDAATKPMHPLGDGRWEKQTVMPAGTYEYRLVVDGQWMTDPLAKETVPNPFGGSNSILRVACPRERPDFGSPEHSPWKTTNRFKETPHHVQPNTSNEQ